MNKWLEAIKAYVSYFFVVLGVYYLVSEHESMTSILEDFYVKFAFLMTIGLMFINLCGKLFKKFTKKKDESV